MPATEQDPVEEQGEAPPSLVVITTLVLTLFIPSTSLPGDPNKITKEEIQEILEKENPTRAEIRRLPEGTPESGYILSSQLDGFVPSKLSDEELDKAFDFVRTVKMSLSELPYVKKMAYGTREIESKIQLNLWVPIENMEEFKDWFSAEYPNPPVDVVLRETGKHMCTCDKD